MGAKPEKKLGNGLFKKLRSRIFFGYILQMIIIVAVLLAGYAFRILDEFYNTLIVSWVYGKNITGAGFILSFIVALGLGLLVESGKGWTLAERMLKKIPILEYIPEVVEQGKKFRELAKKQGLILAPFYRAGSTWWPAIVTGLIPEDNEKYIVTVVFFDPPFFRPIGLNEEETVKISLTLKEAIVYILTWGLAQRFKQRLKKITLGEYIRKNPEILAGI